MTIQSLRNYMTRRESDLTESTVIIERVVTGAFDPDTGTRADGVSTTVYCGPAQIRAADLGDDRQIADVGDHQARWICKVPAAEIEIEIGDIATVTRSPDEHLVDSAWRVEHVAGGDWKSSVTRRLTLADDSP